MMHECLIGVGRFDTASVVPQLVLIKGTNSNYLLLASSPTSSNPFCGTEYTNVYGSIFAPQEWGWTSTPLVVTEPNPDPYPNYFDVWQGAEDCDTANGELVGEMIAYPVASFWDERDRVRDWQFQIVAKAFDGYLWKAAHIYIWPTLFQIKDGRYTVDPYLSVRYHIGGVSSAALYIAL